MPHIAHSHLAIVIAAAAALSAALLAHGVGWWYGPLAVASAHVVLAGGAGLVTGWVTRRPSRASSEHAATGSPAPSAVVERPRFYDWLVRVLLLGGETRLRRRVLALADIGAGDAVLDVGCGTGSTLLVAAEQHGDSVRLGGLEPSAETVAYARRRAAARRLPIEFTEGSADRLPYPDGSFDVVLCTMVLHHLPGEMQADALREMARVLRPGGRVVVLDFERPRSLLATMSLAALFHLLGPGLSPRGLTDAEQVLRASGLDVGRAGVGLGSAAALVARSAA